MKRKLTIIICIAVLLSITVVPISAKEIVREWSELVESTTKHDPPLNYSVQSTFRRKDEPYRFSYTPQKCIVVHSPEGSESSCHEEERVEINGIAYADGYYSLEIQENFSTTTDHYHVYVEYSDGSVEYVRGFDITTITNSTSVIGVSGP